MKIVQNTILKDVTRICEADLMTRHRNNIKYYKKKLNMQQPVPSLRFPYKLWENAVSNANSGICKKTTLLIF